LALLDRIVRRSTGSCLLRGGPSVAFFDTALYSRKRALFPDIAPHAQG
jgi:hypothetical protein